MQEQIRENQNLKRIFEFDPIHTVIEAQRQKKFEYQNIFKAIKQTRDYDLGIDGAIIQSLQIKSKLTSLDKNIIQSLFPVKQILTSSLITQQMLTLKSIEQLSAYELFSKIFVTLMKAMIQVETQVDPKTFKLIASPTGKPYLQIVNEILTKQMVYFQNMVEYLVQIFSTRKASEEYIISQIVEPFYEHLTKVLMFFNYNLDQQTILRLIFNRKSSKVIDPQQIVKIQCDIVGKKIDLIYQQNTIPQGASHLIQYLKSVTQRKRIQYRRQHQQRFNGNFAIVTHIPNISGAILNALDQSQYVFDEKGKDKKQYLQYMQKKIAQTAQQIAQTPQQKQGIFTKYGKIAKNWVKSTIQSFRSGSEKVAKS